MGSRISGIAAAFVSSALLATAAIADDPSPLTIRSLDIEVERSSPAACYLFDANLDGRDRIGLRDRVRVDPPTDVAVQVQGDRLCVAGLVHGQRYRLQLKAGLTSLDGRRLAEDIQDDVAIPDRQPSVRFEGEGYVLPRAGALSVPLRTVNAELAKVKLFEIDERAMSDVISNYGLGANLEHYYINLLGEQKAAEIWDGELVIEGSKNRDHTTRIPLPDFVAKGKSGLYLLTADLADTSFGPPNNHQINATASQWLLVSDIGLSTFKGQGGLSVIARSLTDATAVAGLTVRLISRGNGILAEAVTDEQGHASFEPGLVAGTGSRTPAMITAFRPSVEPSKETLAEDVSNDGADFAFLSLSGQALDLSDRGVAGRTVPGPIDAYLYGDRGIYRPGEMAHVTALFRDGDILALDALPLTFILSRPDGVVAGRFEETTGPHGAIELAIPFADNSQTGSWTLRAHIDPDSSAIADLPIEVQDFVPPRIELALTMKPATLDLGEEGDGKTATIEAKADFLYGAAATDLAASFRTSIVRHPDPFPDWPNYRFGLAQEEWAVMEDQGDLEATDELGRTKLAFAAPVLPGTTLPLAAEIRMTVFEPSGRPTTRIASLPLHRSAPMIGIRPLHGLSSVRNGQTARFDVIALDPKSGDQRAASGLKWDLIKEERDYIWFQEHGRWKWRETVTDRWLEGGDIDLAAKDPATLEFQHDWGYYRLEVYDPKSGEASSVRFRYGWSSSPVANSAAPDRATVTLDREAYKTGDIAKVRITPPFDGKVQLSVLTDRLVHLEEHQIGTDGAVIDLPIEAWGESAYIAVTAIRPTDKEAKRGPSRAIGVAWLSIDQERRRLDVDLDVPETVASNRTVEVELSVSGDVEGEPAWLTLAAVDEGVLQLTDFASPDPVVHFLGQKDLAVEMRDVYGQLIDIGTGEVGKLRTGHDAPSRQLEGLSERSSEVVALYSGVVEVGEDGKVRVPLDLPAYEGRLRLMAAAFSKTAIGGAVGALTVRDPVVTAISLPRFLAPGDESRLHLDLTSLDRSGTFPISLDIQGPITLIDPLPSSVHLDKGRRWQEQLRIRADGIGTADISVRVDLPDGQSLEREAKLAIRSAFPFTSKTKERDLTPGQRLSFSKDLLADFESDDASLRLSAVVGPNFDIPSLIQNLSLYPYGCVEQTSSRLLALLGAEGLNGQHNVMTFAPDDIGKALDEAVAHLMTMQRHDGSFGLWSAAGEPEPWLTAYALHILTLAAQNDDTRIDRHAFAQGLRWLKQATVLRAPDSEAALAVAAYAHYVLTLNGQGHISDLRYLADEVAMESNDPLPRAQLAAALMRFGDEARARKLLEEPGSRLLAWTSHRTTLEQHPEHRGSRYHVYGSALRDSAAVLVFLAETGLADNELDDVAARVNETFVTKRYASTQERAWVLRAADSLRDHAGDLDLEVDGSPVDATSWFVTALDADSSEITLANRGEQTLTIAATASGYPRSAGKALSEGFSLHRRISGMDGSEVDLEAIEAGTLVVIEIEGKLESKDRRQRQSMVVQLLPAGLELETKEVGRGLDPTAISWLKPVTETRFEARRDDRFAAAIDLEATDEGEQFHLAFLARAVTPGHYVLPPTQIEDMYAPSVRARTEAGRMVVIDRP